MCHKCSGKGHWKSVCKAKHVSEVEEIANDANNIFLGVVGTDTDNNSWTGTANMARLFASNWIQELMCRLSLMRSTNFYSYCQNCLSQKRTCMVQPILNSMSGAISKQM